MFFSSISRMATNSSACASGQTCCRSSSTGDCTKNIDQIENLNKLTIDGDEVKPKSFALAKRHGRGAVQSGLTHECGVFGAMACNEWPTQVNKFLGKKIILKILIGNNCFSSILPKLFVSVWLRYNIVVKNRLALSHQRENVPKISVFAKGWA